MIIAHTIINLFSLFPNNPGFSGPWKRSLLKTSWEKEKMLDNSIFSLSNNIFIGLEKKCTICCTLKLSSANAFNFHKAEFDIWHGVTRGKTGIFLQYIIIFFIFLPDDKIFYWSKLKACADHKISMTENLKFVLWRAKNIVGNRENAGYQHFLLLPQYFRRLRGGWGGGGFVKSPDCVVKR